MLLSFPKIYLNTTSPYFFAFKVRNNIFSSTFFIPSPAIQLLHKQNALLLSIFEVIVFFAFNPIDYKNLASWHLSWACFAFSISSASITSTGTISCPMLIIATIMQFSTIQILLRCFLVSRLVASLLSAWYFTSNLSMWGLK